MREPRIGTLAGLLVVAAALSWAGARLWDALGTLPSVLVAAPVAPAAITAITVAL